MDNTENITVLSLCAGYGGLELGLSAALETVFRVVAVEIEAYALANLVSKAEKGKLAVEALWPDLRTFPAERFRGCFDILTAGYPCQPFSVAGKRKGTDDPRHLWPDIAQIVQAVRPVWCFFENVPGHLSIGFSEVYRSLRDMGYKVEAGLFTAAEVGAPHKRQRLFILAESSECDGLRRTARLRWRVGKSSQVGESGRIGQLAESQSKRCRETGEHSSRHSIRVASASGELDNTETAERRWVSEKHIGRGLEEIGRSNGMWPAHPGQPQYEWEEPRVVGNSKQPRTNGTATTGSSRDSVGEPVQGQAQSIVGRAVNEPSSRVDRLRLLGNGVVPQQAEKAFRHLVEKFG